MKLGSEVSFVLLGEIAFSISLLQFAQFLNKLFGLELLLSQGLLSLLLLQVLNLVQVSLLHQKLRVDELFTSCLSVKISLIELVLLVKHLLVQLLSHHDVIWLLDGLCILFSFRFDLLLLESLLFVLAFLINLPERLLGEPLASDHLVLLQDLEVSWPLSCWLIFLEILNLSKRVYADELRVRVRLQSIVLFRLFRIRCLFLRQCKVKFRGLGRIV